MEIAILVNKVTQNSQVNFINIFVCAGDWDVYILGWSKLAKPGKSGKWRKWKERKWMVGERKERLWKAFKQLLSQYLIPCSWHCLSNLVVGISPILDGDRNDSRTRKQKRCEWWWCWLLCWLVFLKRIVRKMEFLLRVKCFDNLFKIYLKISRVHSTEY